MAKKMTRSLKTKVVSRDQREWAEGKVPASVYFTRASAAASAKAKNTVARKLAKSS